MYAKRTDDWLRNPAQQGRSIDDKRDAAVKTRKLVVDFHIDDNLSFTGQLVQSTCMARHQQKPLALIIIHWH